MSDAAKTKTVEGTSDERSASVIELMEIDARYSDEGKDPFQEVLGDIVHAVNVRQHQVGELLARRRALGEPTGFLDDERKALHVQNEAYIRALTIYNDLKKLNRTENFN